MNGKVALAALACVLASAAYASPADTWATWQRDAAHSGYAPDTVSLRDLSYAWSAQVQDGRIAGLAASSVAVFTTVAPQFSPVSLPASLVAQDIATGNVLWTASTPQGQTFGEPAYADGRVYVVAVAVADDYSTMTSTLLCLDAATGTEIWHEDFSAGSGFGYFPIYAPTIAGGIVYVLDVGVAAHRIFALSAIDGSMAWNVPIEDNNTRAVTATADALYVMTNGLATIDPFSGATLDFIADPDGDDPASGPRAPTIIGTTAYAASSSHLLTFDLAAGDIASSLSIHATGQIASDGSDLFVLSAGALSVRDAGTGTLLWGFEAPQGGPVDPGDLSDNLVVLKSHVIATDGLSTYFINRTTHQLELSYGIGGLLAYAGDKVLVADANGIVTAFDLPSDELFSGSFDSAP